MTDILNTLVDESGAVFDTGDLNIVVEVDEDMTPVGYGFELEAATGTIDLHHLADIAARIAEGAGE